MARSKQNQWLWSSRWFLPALSLPNLLCVLYLYHVFNLKAPAANQVTWGPEAGQGVNGHTWELCRGAAAILPLPIVTMWDGWPSKARFCFSQESWKIQNFVRLPSRITLAIKYSNIVSHINASCRLWFAFLHYCHLASKVYPSLPDGPNF